MIFAYNFADPSGSARSAARALHVDRTSVSEAAERYRVIDTPGGYKGSYRQDVTPYTKEVQDCLGKREYEAVVLVASQQSGKTDPIINWALWSALVSPGDLTVYEKAQFAARDFEKRRLRDIAASPEWKAQLSARKRDDSTFTKQWRNGSMTELAWPTLNQLSGKPIPRTALTNFDRWPQDIDGSGNPFDLAKKRNETFFSRGMTYCESSPGFPVTDPQYTVEHPHEAPPRLGILSIFCNRVDRRRNYWPCLECRCWYVPECDRMSWAKSEVDESGSLPSSRHD